MMFDVDELRRLFSGPLADGFGDGRGDIPDMSGLTEPASEERR